MAEKKKVTVVTKKKKKSVGAADASSPKAGMASGGEQGVAPKKRKGLLGALPGVPRLPRLPDLLDFPAGVAESAREIWMAGIGALSTVEEAGADLFDSLVKKGEHWEQESRKALSAAARQAGTAAEGARATAGDLARKPMEWSAAAEAEVQRIVEQSVEGVLHRMNVPTHDEVQDLIQRVQTLTGKVDALSARMKLNRPAGAQPAASAEPVRTDEPEAEVDVYYVAPHAEGWAVEKEGASRATSVHGTKAEAVAAGRERAKAAEPSRLVVHRRDGSVQDTIRYGE